MTLSEFQSARSSATPPPGVSAALTSLWHDARGDWEAAHRIAQDITSADGAWIHAYLHRKEGDAANAAYWYKRAGKPIASGPLDDEWTAIVIALLAET